MRVLIFIFLCVVELSAIELTKGGYSADSKQFVDSKIQKEQFYACVENDVRACENLANSDILSVDECEKMACLGVAQIFVKAGKLQDSIAYYEKACGADILQACFELGNVMEHLGDFKGAMMRYNLGCHFGYLSACRAMGLMYADGVGVKANEPKARRILNDSCLNGDAASCFELGKMYRANNRLKAMQLFKRGCELGESSSCKEFKLLDSANFNVRIEDYVKDSKKDSK
ncbi:hypothetical protein DCO58_08475 [Helicobacter saguini]|uniref:Beta-lactamase n=1 Tax=Helicobacter saguini TaxID=1548018 RepID=A0A347W508_9HELI|nr:tetratricopeptide repeat protein [Helicobacter saguini]MWV61642.1 hypothetical protein [Helicobacter saguini]MWV67686.1 hypothetical protein [Helicobacter saguini]MWV70038.1 hypothetical protein [Helicobacter saguini]MWV72749.1 hypothetical protein [Helicobacter saguini]TLD92740.1 sel1 repeat family protein [Helicobacter saguini]